LPFDLPDSSNLCAFSKFAALILPRFWLRVIDHSKDLNAQIETLGIAKPKYVFSTNHTETYINQIVSLIAPQGKLGLIDDPRTFDIMPFKTKSISIHWELMFTRSMYETDDMEMLLGVE